MNFIKSFLVSPNKSNTGKLLVASSIERGEENYEDPPDHESFLKSTAVSQSSDPEQAGEPQEPTVKKSPEYIYIDYKVEKRDTLYSIALTYHISPEALMEDNKLETDNLETGQRIRIRMKAKPESRRVQGTIINKDEILTTTTRDTDIRYREYRAKTLKQLRMKAEKIPQDHIMVYYCTSFGDAEGELTVEGSCLKFSPSVTGLQTRSLGSFEDINETEKKANLLEVRIDVQDIAECNMMAVPSLLCEENFTMNREFEKDYLLQVLLYTHGEKYYEIEIYEYKLLYRSLGKYLDGLFQERKDKKTPYACVYFKLKSMTETMQEYTNEQKHSMLQEIQAKIMAAKHSKQQGTGSKTPSKIPHFEFLYDRFIKKDAELLRKVVKNSLWADSELINALGNARKVSSSSIEEETKMGGMSGPSSGIKSKKVVPRLRQSSNILNMEQFTELVNSVPELYQMLEWDLMYSNMVHGTSYSNLLRRGEDAAPFILVIQDEDGFIFGAYGNEKLHYSDDYYGNGECFLFTFRDLEEISVFNWTKGNNRLLIFTSDQGLTFGSSPNYGLWVNNELAMGRSYPCQTFHNPRLSHKTDFIIKRIELWTIKEPVD